MRRRLGDPSQAQDDDPGVFEYRDGFVHRLTGPGLGIEIDEAKVRAAAKAGHRWRNPIWRTSDGAVAEW